MKLCVAEKPSVARELAKVLGASTQKDGFFEGNGYTVSWTFGHFCTLKAPEDYDPRLRQWELNWLPIIPQKFSIKLIENEGALRQFGVLESLVKRDDCEEIINCGDAGQEGELIQRWVYQKLGNTKPVKRLWISSLTESAIREGFKTLKDASDFDRLYFAGSARAIGDWLLGINASRLYTLRFGDGKNVLSIGRVQTPTLAMIVARFLEKENFETEAFWEIKTSYRDVLFSYDEGRFTDKLRADILFEEIANEEFEIVDFSKNPGKEYAPKLFDLTALQVDCNKKLNLTADETLQIVQSLYEKKLVTYPRVDTTFLPTDLFPKIREILKQLTNYQKQVRSILEKEILLSKRVFDDKKITDHHAIIPTGVQANQLSGKDLAVYETILFRFLANFYPDCEVSNTKVQGKIAQHLFNANGKEILFLGWRELYQNEEDKDDEKEEEKQQAIPAFELGERGEHQAQMIEKSTSPPKLFTEATLLRAMETAGKQVDDEDLRDALKANGIGRPSTRANIIETLFKREYIVRNRKNLVPTNRGIELIRNIQNDLLKSPELTGLWELKLSQIAAGKYDSSLFMEEMKTMVKDLTFEVKYKTIQTKAETEKPKLICPLCKQGELLKGKKAFGCSKYNSGCSFLIPFQALSYRFKTDKINQSIVDQWLIA